jgi:uncharacterized cupin superfamily protein
MSTNSGKSARQRYVHDFENMPQGSLLGDKLSTSMGAAFTGERVYVGLVTKKRGTGSKAHYHLDETFNYVLEGALKVVMDGEEFIVPKQRYDQRRERQADDGGSLSVDNKIR